MPWQGEEQITKYFGLRGFKCMLHLLMDEINGQRDEHAKPHMTWEEILVKMDNHMSTYAEDDQGPE